MFIEKVSASFVDNITIFKKLTSKCVHVKRKLIRYYKYQGLIYHRSMNIHLNLHHDNIKTVGKIRLKHNRWKMQNH